MRAGDAFACWPRAASFNYDSGLGNWPSNWAYRRIWPENWVDGGGLGITIRNEPRETVLTSIPISGGGVGNAAG